MEENVLGPLEEKSAGLGDPFCVAPVVPAEGQAEVPAGSSVPTEVPAENFSVAAVPSVPLSERDLTLTGKPRKNKGIVSHKPGAGRPTELCDETFRRIRACVLGGGGIKEIAECLQVPLATVYDWDERNYKGFSDRVSAYGVERLVLKARRNADAILDLPLQRATDVQVASSMTQFVLESADKKTFSKRSEITGPDGKDIGVVVLPAKGSVEPMG